MTVISENAIRLIVRKKLKKEGLFKQASSNHGEGSVRYLKCDLSNLRNTKLARTFAKYFLYSPKYEELIDGEKVVYTKSKLMSLLEGGMTDTQSAKFDELVDRAISNDPSIIDAWIDMLSFGITQVFGPMSKMYCNLLSNLFLDDKYEPEEAESLEQDSSTFYLSLASSLEDTGKSLSLEKSLSQFELDFEYKEIVMFPRTFMSIKDGDLPDARKHFQKEILKVQSIIRDDLEPRQIYSRFYDIYSGISNKRAILKPFDRFTSKVNDTSVNGILIRGFLRSILDGSPTPDGTIASGGGVLSKLQRLHGIS